MARTTAVPETTESTTGGATILPGVPLPVWSRPEEPVAPEPEPVAAPVPEPVAVGAVAAAPTPVVPVAAPAPEPPPALLPLPDLDLTAPVPVVDQPWGPPAEAWAAPQPEEWAAPPADAWGAPPVEDWGPPPASGPVDLPPPAGDPVVLAPAPDDETSDDTAPGDDAGARPARSRRPLVLVGAVGGVLVLGAVAAFVWPGLLVSQDDTSSPTPPPASVAQPVAQPVTLQAPATLAGLPRATGPAADRLRSTTTATTLPGYAAPISAAYGAGASPTVSVVAWMSTTRGAAADPGVALAGYAVASGSPVTGVAAAPAGALGGRMSCGTGTVAGTPATVCFWTDDATLGQVTVLHPASPQQGVATATAVRTGVERRG